MGIAMMPQIGWSGTPYLPKTAPVWAFEFFNHLYQYDAGDLLNVLPYTNTFAKICDLVGLLS